jgi:CheY-like chemotaxis protein
VPSLGAARIALAGALFDAVLLDYDLDDGKGTELLAVVRELQPIPLVVATSSHVTGNQALMDAGADAVCPKARFAEIAAVLLRGRQPPTP